MNHIQTIDSSRQPFRLIGKHNLHLDNLVVYIHFNIPEHCTCRVSTTIISEFSTRNPESIKSLLSMIANPENEEETQALTKAIDELLSNVNKN